jgi:hypothetical protein
MGGGEILELVDEQHPARFPRRATGRRVGEQDLDRSVHLLVEVERAVPGRASMALAKVA